MIRNNVVVKNNKYEFVLREILIIGIKIMDASQIRTP